MASRFYRIYSRAPLRRDAFPDRSLLSQHISYTVLTVILPSDIGSVEELQPIYP
jgi:hypothetical protein